MSTEFQQDADASLSVLLFILLYPPSILFTSVFLGTRVERCSVALPTGYGPRVPELPDLLRGEMFVGVLG